MKEIACPPLKYPGGKLRLGQWIRSLAPPHVHRVHLFAGGLGEFWEWEHEGVSEVINDLNGDLTNFYKVLASEDAFPVFVRKVQATPFSQQLWEEATRRLERNRRHANLNPIQQAYYFFILVRMSREGKQQDFATVTRNRTRRGMNEQVSAWWNAVDGLGEVHERLKRVLILNDDAFNVIKSQDGPRTHFYLDPPYVHSTRVSTNDYAEYELDDYDHEHLLDELAHVKGTFQLSGYHSELYDTFAKDRGWVCRELETDIKGSTAKEKGRRIECLWMNYEQGTGKLV